MLRRRLVQIALALSILAPPCPRTTRADEPVEGDLLLEIEGHFHAAKKWFGMVAELEFDAAANGSLTPRFDTLRSRFVLARDPAGQSLGARLPARASGPHEVWLSDGVGLGVRTEEVGIAPAPAEVLRGVVIYRGAIAGGDLLYKLTPTHVDEYIYFRDPPPSLRREIEFEMGAGVSKLRQAGRLIEVVGKDGAARLRLSAPVARAADGARRTGTVRLEGTRFIEEIDLTGLAAPILVDPDWSSTGSMTVAHMADTAWRLPNGKVMAAGGCALASCPLGLATSSCNSVLASCDVWDPMAGTWNAGPTMATARYSYAAAILPNSDLVVAGGCTSSGCKTVTAQAERYSVQQGAWVPAASLPHAKANTDGAALPGGDAIVAGGCDPTTCYAEASRYSALDNQWSNLAPMSAPRGYNTATALLDGTVLVVGGCGDAACAQLLADAELYDPIRNTWVSAGVMSTPRAGHTATLLADGSVLIAGGCNKQVCKASTLTSTEVWVPDAKKGGVFTVGPKMGSPRHHHTATRLDNGDILMAGGSDLTDLTRATAEVYLPVGRRFVQVPRMSMSRAYHTAVALPTGKVLVGGGCNAATCLPWAEIFTSDGLPADVADGGVSGDGGMLAEADMAEAPPDWGAPMKVTGGPHPRLFRSGAFACASDEAVNLACPLAGWPAQDGDYQPNMREFEQPAEGEVRDAVTGLVWQSRGDRQVHDQAGAVAYCKQLATSTAGAGSWRLPEITELMTLSLFGKSGPNTDHAFPDVVQTNYWSATTVAGMKMLGWTVKFDGGDIVQALKDGEYPVRCVRGEWRGPRPEAGHLRLAGALTATANTVRDEGNFVEWQRKDDGQRRTWRESLDYCAHLSLDDHHDWHLPNAYELLSIVEYASTENIKIDPQFTDAHGDIYWTSTFFEGLATLSWALTFNLGVLNAVTNSGQAYARCVRHLPVPPSASSGCGCEIGRRDGEPRPVTGGLAALCVLALAVRRRRAALHGGD